MKRESLLVTVLRSVTEFWSWWWGEIAGLIPEPLRDVTRVRETRLVLVATNEAVSLVEERSRALPQTLASGPRTDEVLEQIRRSSKAKMAVRSRMRCGVRISAADCLERKFEFPRAVVPKLQQILALDLARTTPLDQENAYWAYRWRPSRAGTINVTQFVVRKPLLDGAVRDAESVGLQIAFADAFDGGTGEVLPIDFLAGAHDVGARQIRGRSPIVVSVGAVGLIVLALIQFAYRQHAAIEDLRLEISAARQRAHTVQAAIKTKEEAAMRVDEMRRMKAQRPALSMVWRELTALLPDSAWVTELRMTEDGGQIVGFAASTASLIELVSRSALFMEAAFVAPVTMDAREKKEHFVLAFKFRRPVEGARASQRNL